VYRFTKYRYPKKKKIFVQLLVVMVVVVLEWRKETRSLATTARSTKLELRTAGAIRAAPGTIFTPSTDSQQGLARSHAAARPHVRIESSTDQPACGRRAGPCSQINQKRRGQSDMFDFANNN
jgi:hypothetical protein